MKRQYQFVIGLLFSFLLLTSWSSKSNQEDAFVAISVTTIGKLQNGYGIIMTFMNVESKELVKSKSLGLISPHSMFKDLTPGKYIVSKIEVPLGDLMYINESKELTDFFGVLEFEKGKSYYLGNFTGQREIGRQNLFHLKLDKPDIHPKILKKLKKKRIELKEDDLVKTFPYSRDVLTIY